jgi:hypothetical protein
MLGKDNFNVTIIQLYEESISTAVSMAVIMANSIAISIANSKI